MNLLLRLKNRLFGKDFSIYIMRAYAEAGALGKRIW